MSYVITMPDLVQSAAQDLAGIRASLTDAAATAGPTTGIVASAADEVSIAIASLFGSAGRQFQALSAQAQAFQAEFERLLGAGAAAYVTAEVANAGQVLGTAVAGGAPAAAAAVPAAAVQRFTLFGGILTLEIGADGVFGTVGTPGINLPEVNIPPINLSSFNLPQVTIPAINIPAGTTPPNVTLSPFNLPQLTIPSINIPAGATPPNVTVGAFGLPQITTPTITVPPISLPAISIPPFQTPLVTVSGWSLPSVTVPQINIPVVQLPNINVPGGDQTLLSLTTGNIIAPNYDIVLRNFNINAISFGLSTQGYIGAFNFPSIGIGTLTLPFVTVSNPSGGTYTFPSIGLSGFNIPSVTVPSVGVGEFTLPQLSWPGFATAPLTIPPVGVDAFDLPHIHIPNITVEPITIGQFHIPPATGYIGALQSNASALVAELAFIGSSLTGVGVI
jgi:hypothetical protein